MKKLPYKHILFDLGGVLIDIDYFATEKAFSELGFLDFNSYYSQFQQSDLFDRLEKGLVSPQFFVNQLLPYCRQGTTPNQVVRAWNAMLGGFPERKVKLLHELKATGISFSMLSNTNELHFEGVKRAWKKANQDLFSPPFENVFLSHEIGRRKPDATTFEWVLNEINCSAEDVLFIEDSPQHIEGAKSIGLNCHFYTKPEDFYALFN